jgi:hypothetical protein
VGFNPFRQQRVARADVLMVAATIAVAIGLVLWALFGR